MTKQTLQKFLLKKLVANIALSFIIGILINVCINQSQHGLFWLINWTCVALGLLIFSLSLIYYFKQLHGFLDNPQQLSKFGVNPFFSKIANKIQLIQIEKQQLSEQHHRLDTMRKDFVANVSHELRTPVTVMMGYLETFSQQPDLNPRWQRAFLQMLQQSDRMNNIINDLLLLSRLENSENNQQPTLIDMPKLLAQLFDDAQVYNHNFEHLIHLHIDSQQQIMGYEDLLTSALSNLITNAIKYTPKGGEVTIGWFEKTDGYYFSVSDNGIGIDALHIERLTERFYRVDSGRSRETGGTGLGLAIVKHVVHKHNAKLNIQSKVGKGSTFSIIFVKHQAQ
ncbi:histidine kinase [Moraxella macacae 0408225]|uniref:histidine kinase n=1 Tax=Moraxella macacae 0408225 TaxID=1230338 RepID=L2F8Z1_9GAMM|nr:histidine kinase [Moraxella macacae 0408225]